VNAQAEWNAKLKRLAAAVKAGNASEACTLSTQLKDTVPPTLSPKGLENLEAIQAHQCMEFLQQQFNSPQCQKYQNAKARCAPANDYRTCMSRMGANISDYAFMCGD